MAKVLNIKDCNYKVPNGAIYVDRAMPSYKLPASKQYYLWHGKECKLLTRPIYRKGIKRNGLIQLATGEKIVIPIRALRLP